MRAPLRLADFNNELASTINDVELGTGLPIDRAAEIERLARLDPIDYETARGPAAERLGVRTSVLDNEVRKKRRELRLENGKRDDGSGRPLELPEILPWPEEIEGDHVASALSATFKRYVRMSDVQANLCALWVL